jgi:hypothetical protein
MTQHARAQQKKSFSKLVSGKKLIQLPRRLQLRKTNAVGICFFSPFFVSLIFVLEPETLHP